MGLSRDYNLSPEHIFVFLGFSSGLWATICSLLYIFLLQIFLGPVWYWFFFFVIHVYAQSSKRSWSSSLLCCSWKAFKRHMLNMRSHSDAKGIELKRPNDSIYTFPCPDCMCRVNRSEVIRWSVSTICLEREIVLIFVVSSLYASPLAQFFYFGLEPHSFISSWWEHPFSFLASIFMVWRTLVWLFWFGRIASHFVHAGREYSLEKEASTAAGVLTGH